MLRVRPRYALPSLMAPMRRFRSRRAWLAALLPVVLGWHGPAWSAGGMHAASAVEEEVWALEHAYFARLYRADYDGVLALVHERFLAWPSGAAQPIGRDESARFMRQLVPAPTPCTVAIERGGIRLQATVALTEYTLRVDCGGPDPPRTSRITHTWVREGGRWRLLGGMSRDG